MLDPNLIPKHQGTELPSAMEAMPRGDVLLPYQQRSLLLLGTSALVVIEKSRRIGLTWALAAHAVLMASARRDAGGKDVLYISYAHDMTREFIDACAMWAKAFLHIVVAIDDGYMFRDAGEGGHSKDIKSFRIDFASGFSIVGLPGVPRALRGRQGLVFIDEAAFVDNLAELLKSAMALLIWGGQVVVVSTHNGVENPFNLLLDEIRSGKRKGASLTITLKDAMKDGLYERICLVTRKTPSPEGKIQFEADIRAAYGDDAEEELDCVPKTGAGCFLPAADLAACEHEDAGKPELYGKGLVVIGRDVARRRDLAVIWAFELVGNILWLRERWEKANASFAAQDAVFDRMFTEYRVLRALIDQTGMGEKVVEDQIAKKGSRVEGVLFTAAAKLDMANALKARVETHTIMLPPDPAIRTDLRAIKKTKGGGDTVRLANDDSVHADMFWAAALACLAAETDGPACQGFIAVPKSGRAFDEPAGDERRGGRRGSDEDRVAASMKGTW